MILGLVYYLELIFWFYAVRHIDVSVASSITVPWPALTMVLAVLVLGLAGTLAWRYGLGWVPVLGSGYGDAVRFRAYTRRRPFMARFVPGLMGSGADAIAGAIEERALFARYGL